MQTIEPKISEAFLNFTQTIKSPKTRTNYIQSLKYYMKFSRLENYDDLLTNADPKDIQRNIIMFIEFCKNKGLSSSTIKGYTAAIKHFYESNDIEGLKWRKIIAHHPAAFHPTKITHEITPKTVKIFQTVKIHIFTNT